MRKIKIDNKIHDFDISDGKGNLSFGCNGVGGMRAYLDGKNISDNCFVENHNMLDGEVNFKEETKVINFSFYKYFTINDERNTKLLKILIHNKYKEITFKEKIKTVLFGLKYFDINYIAEGYHFGKELTYKDFCICFNGQSMVIFASNHNGYIVPDYLELQKDKDSKNFNIVYRVIKRSIKKYFDI